MIELWSVPFSGADRVMPIGGWDSLDTFLKKTTSTAPLEYTPYHDIQLPKQQQYVDVPATFYALNYNLLTSGGRAYWVSPLRINAATVRLNLTYEPLLSNSDKNPTITGDWHYLSSFYANAKSKRVGGFVYPQLTVTNQNITQTTVTKQDEHRYRAFVLTNINKWDSTSSKSTFVESSTGKAVFVGTTMIVLLVSYVGLAQMRAENTKMYERLVAESGFKGWYDVYLPTNVNSNLDYYPDNAIVNYTPGNNVLADTTKPHVSLYYPGAFLRQASGPDSGYEVINMTGPSNTGTTASSIATLPTGDVVVNETYDLSAITADCYYPSKYYVLSNPMLRTPLVIDMNSVPSGATELRLITIVGAGEQFIVLWNGSRWNKIKPLVDLSYETIPYSTSAKEDYVASNPYSSGTGRILGYISQGIGWLSGTGSGATGVANSAARAATAGGTAAANAATAAVTGGVSLAITAATGLAQYGMDIANNEGKLNDLNSQLGNNAATIQADINNVLYNLGGVEPDRAKADTVIYLDEEIGTIGSTYAYLEKRFGIRCNIHATIGSWITTAPSGISVDTSPVDGYAYAEGDRVILVDSDIDGLDYRSIQSAFSSGIELYYPGATFRPYNS